MRKNTLAMSIAAMIGGLGFVGAASADVIVGTGAVPTNAALGLTNATNLVVNNGGVGHQLIVPYFTAQNGNATIINVTNTDTANGKVMKVRFRGASNSDDILDFTVLMSPGDVWNATVTAPSTTAPAQIVTSDKSCTLPQLAVGVPQPFLTSRLTNKASNDVNANTREGYVEIFNMADIPSTPSYGTGGTAISALYTAIKHVNGTAPCTQSVLDPALVDNNWLTEAQAAPQGLATPTTGLYGNWTIINVPETTTYSGEMVAIRAVDALGNDARGNFVVFRQKDLAYNGPSIDWVTADPVLRTTAFGTMVGVAGVGGGVVNGPVFQAAHFDLPDMSTPYVTGVGVGTPLAPLSQAGLLTTALAVTNIMSDYATDPLIAAKTDWVFSMPTRRYSVAMDYQAGTAAAPRRLYSRVLGTNGNAFFHDGNTSVNSLNAAQLCVTAQNQTFYDREESTKTGGGAVFSPGNVSRAQFCGETSVLSFADGGISVLGGAIARQDTGSSGFVNGWGRVGVRDGGTLLGLPIVGNAFIKATNSAVRAGVSGTYGLTAEHRFTR